MSMNRYLAALLSLFLLLSFTACHQENSSTDSSPLTTSQLQEIEDYLNDTANRSFIPQETHSIQYPITVLGGEIDSQNRLLISYVDADFGVRPYLLTLKKNDYEYQFLSNVKTDDNIINTLSETALVAYQNDPRNERFIGDIQPETIAVCRMDDGKYYQITLSTSYDAIWVFVSEEELSMSATWDWILIGDRSSFSIDNLGKLIDSGKANYEDSNANKLPENYLQIIKNEKPFHFMGEEILIDNYKSPYLQKQLTQCDDVQYAVLDMDGDGKKEVLISGWTSDILILHEENGSIYGFDFTFREMYHVKSDGSYDWNASQGNAYGCSKLSFENGICTSIEIHRVENEENHDIRFFVDGIEVSKDDYDLCTASRSDIANVTWYKLDVFPKNIEEKG